MVDAGTGKLSRQDVEEIAETICLGIHSSNGALKWDFAQYGIALKVIQHFVGTSWIRRFIVDPEKVDADDRAGREFFGSDLGGEENGIWYKHRVITLAECLLGLQDVPNFPGRLETLIRNEQDLESLYGELECGSMLLPYNFEFVKPVSEKGKDYDGKITTASQEQVCCEVKVKSHRTGFSFDTIYRTLEHARNQNLPKGKPGIVLIKVPVPWVREETGQPVVDAIQKVMRQSDRLVAIVLRWDELHRQSGQHQIGEHEYQVARMAGRFRVFFNGRPSALLTPDIREVLNSLGRLRNPNWIWIHEVLAEVAARLSKETREK